MSCHEAVFMAEKVSKKTPAERPWKITCAIAPFSAIFPVVFPIVSQEQTVLPIFEDRTVGSSWIDFL